MMHHHFVPLTKLMIDEQLVTRIGESKLGEVVDVPGEQDFSEYLKYTPALFVIFGVAEDIGVLANHGRPGTANAWHSFLKAFVNVQHNQFTNAQLAIAGYFSFDDLKKEAESKSVDPAVVIESYRKAVEQIDVEIAAMVNAIVSAGKIPVVIGGGHNNAYPIIRGAAEGSGKNAINAVNLDAHIDYRQREGRHSGNGFRYAKEEGYLKKYFAIGVHENYLPASILSELTSNNDIRLISFEDIFVRFRFTWHDVLEEACAFVGNQTLTGVELDLDCLENFEASAATPVGLSSREALQFVHIMASRTSVAYIHICEGISSSQSRLTGKFIAYAVAEFIRSIKNRDHGDRLRTLI